MRRLNKKLGLLLLPFLLVACQSYKKVPYLQDVEVVEQVTQQENYAKGFVDNCSVLHQSGIGFTIQFDNC